MTAPTHLPPRIDAVALWAARAGKQQDACLPGGRGGSAVAMATDELPIH